MFGLGMISGAAEGVVEGQERIRQRIERQVEEARRYSSVAKEREQEAAKVRTQIANASKSYGVSEKVLFSAYKNGHMDDYLTLIEKARAKNGNISPQVLESYYEVPASLATSEVDIDKEIRSAFGVIGQNVDRAEAPEDVGFQSMFFDALGVDSEGAARRGLRGQTVGGYSVEDLLSMPELKPIQGDGGRINPSLYADAKPDGSEDTMYTDQYVVDTITKDQSARIGNLFGGRFASPAQREAIEGDIRSAIARYKEEKGITGFPSEEQISEALQSVIRVDENGVYANTKQEDPNNPGTFLWTKIDENGQRNGLVPETQIGAATVEEGESSAKTTNEKPVQAQTPPPVVVHPVYGEIKYAGQHKDGRQMYFLPTGQVVEWPFKAEQSSVNVGN